MRDAAFMIQKGLDSFCVLRDCLTGMQAIAWSPLGASRQSMAIVNIRGALQNNQKCASTFICIWDGRVSDE